MKLSSIDVHPRVPTLRATIIATLTVAAAILAFTGPSFAFNSGLAGIYVFAAPGYDKPACNQSATGSVAIDGRFSFTVKSGLSYYLIDGRFDENLSWEGDLVGRDRVPFRMHFEGDRIIATNLDPDKRCAPIYIGTKQRR